MFSAQFLHWVCSRSSVFRILALWTNNDLVGCSRNLEWDAARLIFLHRSHQIQGRKWNLSVPRSVGVIVCLGVQDAIGDRIAGDLFTAAILKNKSRRRWRVRYLGCSDIYCWQYGLHVFRLVIRGSLVADPNIMTIAQFDEQWLFWLMDWHRRLSGRRLLNHDKGWGSGNRIS